MHILKAFMHCFKVFRYITIQALKTFEITKKTIINTYKLEMFE